MYDYVIKTLSSKIVGRNPDQIFRKLNCAAKAIVAFRLILKKSKVSDTLTKRKKDILLDRSDFVWSKNAGTYLKDTFNKTDIIEPCNREKVTTNWKFYKLTNTISCFTQRRTHGRKDAVSPKRLMKNHKLRGLTFDGSTRQPHFGNSCSPFAQEPKTGRRNINRKDGFNPRFFQVVPLNNNSVLQDFPHF